MKVAFYGNVCNNFYALAKALRNEMNIDAHLYLNPKADVQNRPESDDSNLKDNYPHWIHLSEKWDPVLFFKKSDKRFLHELNQYDAVFMSEYGPMLSPYLKTKTLFYTTGGDLTMLPFPAKFSHKFKGIVERLKWEFFGYMQRRGIRNCSKILTQPFFPFSNALSKLGIAPSKISKCYFPILIDTASFSEKSNALDDIDVENKTRLAPFKFVIFHPSRINLDQSGAAVDSGQWKGNDNLLKGFALFLKQHNIKDACIAMPDRIFSPDILKARKIIDNLGIGENIVWLKPPAPEGFPRKQLVNFYSSADLVADEFGIGWFGSIVLEGMACGKPTLCYVDEGVMRQLYPWHPIVSVKTPEQIAHKIAEFYFDKSKRVQVGQRSRLWVEEFHSFKNGTAIYTHNFRNDLKDIFNFS